MIGTGALRAWPSPPETDEESQAPSPRRGFAAALVRQTPREAPSPRRGFAAALVRQTPREADATYRLLGAASRERREVSPWWHTAWVGAVAALATVACAEAWWRLGPRAVLAAERANTPRSRVLGPSRGLTLAAEGQEPFNVRLAGGCCDSGEAKCLACMIGRSVEDFCGDSANSAIPGCEEVSRPVCCSARTATCLACEAQLSVSEFCVDVDNADVLGCAGVCGLVEEGYDYPGGESLSTVNYLPSADACCAMCRAEKRCATWTWERRTESPRFGQCSLNREPSTLQREQNPNVTSGLPGRGTSLYQLRHHAGRCVHLLGTNLVRVGSCVTSAWPKEQQWTYDRRTGQLISSFNTCLSTMEDGEVSPEPCIAMEPTQRWEIDSSSGHLRNSDACLTFQGGDLRMATCETNAYAQKWKLWRWEVLEKADALAAIFGGGSPYTSTGSTSSSSSAPAVTSTTITTTMVTTAMVTTTSSSSTSDSYTSTRTTMSTSTRTTTTSTRTIPLFCFSLMLPWGYEPELLEMQFDANLGIFTCDQWEVYTNEDIDLKGLKPTKLDIDLKCKKEGVFHTFYNTPVFIKIWQQIFKDGRVDVTDWTVKVDPDAVFMVPRLREQLAAHHEKWELAETKKGIFINNCKYGLHGPFEIVSHRGMKVYKELHSQCEEDPERPPQEDAYLQTCLVKIGVQQLNAFDVMVEDHCDPDVGWKSCMSDYSVFHPFKTVDSYQACWQNARIYQAQEPTSDFAAFVRAMKK